MALYREMAGKAEDSDSPEKIVRRVQEVSAVLYHLEQVWGGSRGALGGPGVLLGVLRVLLRVSRCTWECSGGVWGTPEALGCF